MNNQLKRKATRTYNRGDNKKVKYDTRLHPSVIEKIKKHKGFNSEPEFLEFLVNNHEEKS